MNKQQFDKALTLALSNQNLNDDDSALHGCALPNFITATVTLNAAAKFIRYHVVQLDGTVDADALQEIYNIALKKWNVLNTADPITVQILVQVLKGLTNQMPLIMTQNNQTILEYDLKEENQFYTVQKALKYTNAQVHAESGIMIVQIPAL